MPQIGWLEILIIVSIAIIVVGPKDFPLMLKKMGSWIGSIKRYLSDVQNQVSEITDNSIEDEKSIKKSSEKNENIKDING
ncbi:Sec-independent protein translocase protein TatB [Candidatus Pelagibacter communis]|jgi:sec-independent protein translocase protein TatB|uniref:Sec-independent protein translocase protein TatB n=1 Tax=Pelagibacter ubique TaxID=198252 RepID=UPI00094CB39F|nr:Sec-independent protein translocase protein TatB [Candidatus Pelagibacter ubique]|tara:strand:+ start:1232 stop:1471 length:240 start_codon:yes stop_codon:yes gene_type:complete